MTLGGAAPAHEILDVAPVALDALPLGLRPVY